MPVHRGKIIPLPTNVGTAEFQTAYDAAKALIEGGQQTETAGTSKPKSGTLRRLSVESFRSSEFKQLADSTQREWRSVLEHT